MLASTLTQKGQITIPKKIRDALSLKPNDSVVFVHRNNEIIIKPLHDVYSLRGVIKSKNKKDLNEIRKQTQKEVGKRIAHE